MLEHCTTQQLKELLALGCAGVEAPADWLLEIGDRERLESLLREMCTAAGYSGTALLAAVCSSRTPLERLVVIKRIAKQLAGAAQAPAQIAAATLLYHLSIAAALAFHNQNISSKTSPDRLHLYQKLAAELFDDRLAAVFAKALHKLPATTG